MEHMLLLYSIEHLELGTLFTFYHVTTGKGAKAREKKKGHCFLCRNELKWVLSQP